MTHMKTNKIYSIGYIYKITNTKNKKAYIGQTTRTVEDRWYKHQRESIGVKARLDTKFARALRKYGVDNFKVETLEVLKDCTKQELTNREHYWVYFYNTIEEGYNVQDPLVSSGGNTYAGKTAAELAEISNKISKTKQSGLNPNATAVKFRNVDTNEILHFDCVEDACRYFNEKNHITFCRRYDGKIKQLYKKVWQIVKEQDEFPEEFVRKTKHPRSHTVKIIDLDTNKSYVFDSCVECEQALGIPRKAIPKIVYNTKRTTGKFKNYLFEYID